MASIAGPTGQSRIFQIHPTRFCNLRCLHCYSSSGPEERGELHPDLLRSALGAAASEGYTVAGFSGGEPLLYEPLPEVLEGAKEAGLFTTVTTNGMPLDERRLERLSGRVDLLAISLDGSPESHNQMRVHPRAFQTMASRLPALRDSGLPFGFIFTLTQFNVHELPWVASFALGAGAKLLQIHPLEVTGRATTRLPHAGPDATEASWAYVAAASVQQQVGDRLQVQLDLFHVDALRRHPERVFADREAGGQRLGELLSPLILEPDGTLVPVQYGFPRRFALGNLTEEPFESCAERWRRELQEPFGQLCRWEHCQLVEADGMPLANWYERLSRRASSSAAPPRRSARAV